LGNKIEADRLIRPHRQSLEDKGSTVTQYLETVGGKGVDQLEISIGICRNECGAVWATKIEESWRSIISRQLRKPFRVGSVIRPIRLRGNANLSHLARALGLAATCSRPETGQSKPSTDEENEAEAEPGRNTQPGFSLHDLAIIAHSGSGYLFVTGSSSPGFRRSIAGEPCGPVIARMGADKKPPSHPGEVLVVGNGKGRAQSAPIRVIRGLMNTGGLSGRRAFSSKHRAEPRAEPLCFAREGFQPRCAARGVISALKIPLRLWNFRMTGFWIRRTYARSRRSFE